MATQHFPKRLFQGLHIEWPSERHARVEVVGQVVGIDLMNKPDSLLRERQRNLLTAHDSVDVEFGNLLIDHLRIF